MYLLNILNKLNYEKMRNQNRPAVCGKHKITMAADFIPVTKDDFQKYIIEFNSKMGTIQLC